MSKINLSQLIAMLSDEAFTSGEDIASHFGVSRTAVAKQIKSLQEMGLDIYSVNRRGYKLQHPVSLLSKGAISAALTEPDAGHLDIHLVLDSTNDYVRRTSQDCLMVTPVWPKHSAKGRAGRARHGFRHWVLMSICP